MMNYIRGKTRIAVQSIGPQTKLSKDMLRSVTNITIAAVQFLQGRYTVVSIAFVCMLLSFLSTTSGKYQFYLAMLSHA